MSVCAISRLAASFIGVRQEVPINYCMIKYVVLVVQIGSATYGLLSHVLD